MTILDMPCDWAAGQVVPYGWLTDRQRSNVAEFGVGSSSDWRLAIVRWLASARFNITKLPRWRRRFVDALLNRYLQKVRNT